MIPPTPQFLVLCLATGGLVLGCGPADDGERPRGTGGEAEPSDECGSEQDISIVPGTGVGALFTPYGDGDPVVPYFGSQAGMEVDISVRLAGVLRRDIDSIEVSLLVDGEPIGWDTFSPRDLYCESGSGTIETPVLIDVTEHPTVSSVAQLGGRDAEITVTVVFDDGAEASTVDVVLEI